MKARSAAWGVALAAALTVTACSPLGRGEPNSVRTGSVASQAGNPLEAPSDALSLSTFEATDFKSGLTCTGSYNPLENAETFTAAVVCDNGRTGEVTGMRSRDLSGTATLTLAGGETSSVALRPLAGAEQAAPPASAKQLPSPDPFSVANDAIAGAR